MPTTPQPPARPPVQSPPQQAPVNRPQGSTIGTATAAQTYPPGSPRRAAVEREGVGPDPHEAKLRPDELPRELAEDEPVVTIAQEQRERSADYEAEGVERVKARLDERDPSERPRTVPGVSPTQVEP